MVRIQREYKSIIIPQRYHRVCNHIEEGINKKENQALVAISTTPSISSNTEVATWSISFNIGVAMA